MMVLRGSERALGSGEKWVTGVEIDADLRVAGPDRSNGQLRARDRRVRRPSRSRRPPSQDQNVLSGGEKGLD